MSQEIQSIAHRYLSTLRDDSGASTPAGVDDKSEAWADAFLEAIRQSRKTHPDGEARAAARRLGLSSTKNEYRFFWECWQNADDAGAKNLKFILNQNCLIIENDGNEFSARDVYSLCFVASSQKAGRADKKGHYGVGFLSLMRVCEAPEVQSGAFHFRLENDYTYPQPLLSTAHFAGTRIVAPLSEGTDLDAFRREMASRLTEEVLLYMSNLERVEFVDEISGDTVHIEVKRGSDQEEAHAVYISDEKWLCYRKTIRAEPGLKRLDGEPVADELPVVLTRCEARSGPHYIASFFPTEESHRLPWRFSAPLEVTTSRESLLESDYNRWLLARVGELMVDAAIDPTVGDRVRPWRLVPGKDGETGQLSKLYEAAHGKLRKIEWIPTADGPKRPADVLLPASIRLRRLFRLQDVEDPDLSRRVWIRTIPDETGIVLLRELGVCYICCHELSKMIHGGPTRDSQWYLRTVAEVLRLAKKYDQWKAETVYERLRSGRCFKDASGQPFSLIEVGRSGRLICSTRSQNLVKEVGRVAEPYLVLLNEVYRPPERKRDDPLDADREGIHQWLRSESGDLFQYEVRLDAVQFIRHFVAKPHPETEEEPGGGIQDALLDLVRDHLEAYLSEYKGEVSAVNLGRNLSVAAFSFDGNGKVIQGRVKATEVYLGKSYSKNPWAFAASSVPGLWWLNSKYKKRLNRDIEGKAEGKNVLDFFRALGATDVPRLEKVPYDAKHGKHFYSHITRNDRVNYPHFPHDARRWNYNHYGTQDDYESPDLDMVLAALLEQPVAARNERGRALLSALQNDWESLKDRSLAFANAYESNVETNFGLMPTRWLYNLRTSPWMKMRDGSFGSPEGKYAGTEDNIAILGKHDGNLCAWDCENATLAKALQLRTQVLPATIRQRLLSASKGNRAVAQGVATACYASLARNVTLTPEVKAWFTQDPLIFYPAPTKRWWSPQDCLRGSFQHIFGDRRANVAVYANTEELWRCLDIETEPSLRNLQSFWAAVSESEPDEPVLKQLASSYSLADGLCSQLEVVSPVPVWTDRGWKSSNESVVVQDDEIWLALGEPEIPRWQKPSAGVFSNFCRWAGLTVVEDMLEFGEPTEVGESSEEDTRCLHLAASQFATEVVAIAPGLWNDIASVVKGWTSLEVIRVTTLELPFEISLPNIGLRTGNVRRNVTLRPERLYLSALTGLGDTDVVAALTQAPKISGTDLWNVRAQVRLKLLEAFDADAEVTELPPLPEDRNVIPFDLFEEQDEDEERGQDDLEARPSLKLGPPQPASVTTLAPQKPAPIPAGSYKVKSDASGDGMAEGGPLPVTPVVLKTPVPPRPGIADSGLPRPNLRAVEQRGLDLLNEYVLKPAGVRLTDQRPRAGYGADLACDDGIFRELKTFSGDASTSIGLTAHEYARAVSAKELYHLVIVERVWTSPRITIIPNPVNVLNSKPTGGVEVIDWRAKASKFRVVELEPSETTKPAT